MRPFGLFRVFFLFVAFVLSQHASAGAIAELFKNQPTPNYFSGTNCVANGSVTISGLGTRGFVAARLWLGGELVKSWEAEDGIIFLQHLSMSVVFDSTHWPDGTLLHVGFEADGDDGVTYVAPPKDIIIRNQRTIFGRYDLGSRATYLRVHGPIRRGILPPGEF